MNKSMFRSRWLAAAAAVTVAATLLPGAAGALVIGICGSIIPDGAPVSEPGPYSIGKVEVIEIASEVDGTVIQIGVVRPDAGPSHRSPIIAVGSPYFRSDLEDVELTDCSPFLVNNYVPHGYTIAFIPTRGAGGTDNCQNLMGDKERADLDQAVTWLGTQPWSSGAVGMIGLSYTGSTPWEVAAEGNPHLKTIVPAGGVHNLFHLLFHRGRNDTRGPAFSPGYYYAYGISTPVGGREADRHVGGVTGCDDAQAGVEAGVESFRTNEYDSRGYWAERNMDPAILERYSGSVLLVQGLQDWNVDPGHQYPFVSELEERGVYVKHLLGQWGHEWPHTAAPPARRDDFADTLLAWWDRWLKGDRSADTGPRVEVQDSDNQWRTARSWPARNARARALYLGSDGTMSEKPIEGSASAMLGPGTRNRHSMAQSDARHDEIPGDRVCQTCAMFTYDVGGEDLRLTGIPSLDLRLVPTGPSGHVAAFVYRVHGDDQWQLIGWGASDLRFPDDDDQAQPVVASEPIEMNLPLQPLDAVVHEGEQVLIVLDQGNADHTPGVPFFPVELRYGAGVGALHFDDPRPASTKFFEPKSG